MARKVGTVRRKKSAAQAKSNAVIPATPPSSRIFYDRWRRGAKVFESQKELMPLIEEYALLCQENNLPFLKVGFAVWLGISQQTLYNYLKDPFFQEANELIDTLSEFSLLHGGLTDQFNASLTKFVLSNKYGYRERVDATVETSGDQSSAVTINLIEKSVDNE